MTSGIEPIFVRVGISVARALLSDGARNLIVGQDEAIRRVIGKTSAQFESIDSLESSLHRWVESDGFETVLERLVIGERDFFDEIVSSFIDNGDFYLPDEEQRLMVAKQIVASFIGPLLAEIFESTAGLSSLSNRIEERFDALEARLDKGFAIDRGNSSMSATSRVLPEDPETLSEASSTSHKEISTRIDSARDLVDEGYVKLARSRLEQIQQEEDSLPNDLKFRVKSNLGACALALGNVTDACELLEEAHSLEPENVIGIANAALASQLKSDHGRAMARAIHARGIDPKNSQATSVLINALCEAGNFDAFEGLINTEDWILQDHQCGLVIVSIWMQQSRFADAISLCRTLVRLYPDDPLSYLALAECLFYSSEVERHDVGYSGDLAERLDEAVAVATKVIESLRDTQLQPRVNEALLVRACAQAILGREEEALLDFDRILDQDPTHADAAYNKGLCLLTSRRPTDARKIFEGIEDAKRREDSAFPLAVACLEAGDPKAAYRLLAGKVVLDCPTWDEVHKAEILREAASQSGQKDDIDDILSKALVRNPDNPKLLVLAAIRQSDAIDAEDMISKALELADESDRHSILEFLAILYQRLGNYSKAADQLTKLVNGVPSHPCAISLLFCLAKSSRFREALAWARTIRASDFKTSKTVLDLEVDLLQEAGDLSSVIERLTEIHSRNDVHPSDSVLLAMAQFRYGMKTEARETVSIINTLDLKDEPWLMFLVAQIKSLVGLPEYMNDAYLSRRYGIDNPMIHIGYSQMVIGAEDNFDEPDVVGPGCAVKLRLDSTEQWWYILDDGEEPLGPNDLAGDQELAHCLSGKRAGETVVLREGLEELSYEIAEIQSKFVRVFQETFEGYSTRFPSDSGLFSVKVKNDDFSKVFQSVDQQNEMRLQLTRMYEEKKLPFATFSHWLGRPMPDVWQACTQMQFSKIRFSNGMDELAFAQDKMLREADSVVLDLLSLLTIRELGLIEALRARFSRVAVSQAVVDEIQKYVAESVILPMPSGMLGKTNDGLYSMQEVDSEVWQARREDLRGLLEFAESIGRIPSYPLLDVAKRDEAVNAITKHGAGAIFAGGYESNDSLTVVCDDLGLSELATTYGINTVNTQSLLWDLLQSKTISDDEYSRCIERLTLLNYEFVRVRAEDIVRRLEANDFLTTGGIRAMLNTLSGPDCTEESAVGVASDVFKMLVGKLSTGHEELILLAVIEVLKQGRQGNGVILKFRDEIEKKFNLLPLRRDFIVGAINLRMRI